MSQPGLSWFLARLEEALRQGRPPDASWLCEGHPEMLPTVEHALEIFQRYHPPSETLVGGHVAPPTSSPLQATLAGSSRHLGDAAAPPSYEILGILGRGGMGVVYRARQTTLNRVVALKMILAGGHADPEDLARFLTEAELMASLQHPNILQVFEFGTHEGLPFIAMELCPGGSLAQKLAGVPISSLEAAALVERVARAMQVAHAAGIVHRDLKPANILLSVRQSFPSDSGVEVSPECLMYEPKVTDFGLAKRIQADSHLTRTGALLGTPSYMAPEQARASKHTGPPADIYAMGAILYECLTGRPPFKGATAMETLEQVISAEPVSVRHLQQKVPRDLETICHKALHKEPARRYATSADLADDLRRFLNGEPVLARPVGPVERGWKWVKRRPVVTGLFAAFVLSLVGGMAVSSRWAYIANQREALARASEKEARDALDAAGRIAVLLASNVLAPIEPPVLNREGQRNEGMSSTELTAIEELAALPKEIDRVALIRRILENPSTARNLSWRLRPVLRALIGLDLDRRDAVLELIRPRILDEKGDPVTRLVCARIFSRLGAGDDPAARAAAALLLDTVGGDLTAGEQIAALEDLVNLAGRISTETSVWLCDRVVAMARHAPAPTLQLMAQACKEACDRMPPGQRRDGKLARELLERLTLQAGQEAQELALWHMLHAFAIVGAYLPDDQAEAAVARLVALAEQRHRAASVEAAGEVVRVLAGNLAPAVQRDAQTRLSSLALRLVPTTSDGWLLDGLARTLTVSLPGAEPGPLVKPFEAAVAAKPTARQVLALSPMFPEGVGRLPAGEASRLAGLYVDALEPRIATPGQAGQRDRLVQAYVVAASRLDSTAARSRLSFAAQLVKTAVGPEQLALAAEILGALAGRISLAERELILAGINTAINVHLAGNPDAVAINRLSRAVAAVAALEPVRGRRMAVHLDRDVGRLLAATRSAEQLGLLARALAGVAPWLEEHARRRRVDELTDKLASVVRPDSPLGELVALRQAVEAVRPWVDPVRLNRICETFAPTVVREVAQDKWMIGAARLVAGLLAPLPINELVAILRQPSCIGPSETEALAALSNRVGQKFDGVWDAVRWLKANRPDVNLTATPRPAS